MRRGVALALVLAFVLAGCAGSAHPRATAKPPRLPRALAHSWASQANAVAQSLAAGDGCSALAQATALQTEVDRAVSARRVPLRLRATLLAAVDGLPGRITCNPTPPPEPPKHEKKHEKPPKHDHHKDHAH